MDLVSGFDAIHQRHVQVHQDEVEVVSAALLGYILDVALQAMLTISAGLHTDVQESVELHLQRDDIVANVIDDHAAIRAFTVRVFIPRQAFICRTAGGVQFLVVCHELITVPLLLFVVFTA